MMHPLKLFLKPFRHRNHHFCFCHPDVSIFLTDQAFFLKKQNKTSSADGWTSEVTQSLSLFMLKRCCFTSVCLVVVAVARQPLKNGTRRRGRNLSVKMCILWGKRTRVKRGRGHICNICVFPASRNWAPGTVGRGPETPSNCDTSERGDETTAEGAPQTSGRRLHLKSDWELVWVWEELIVGKDRQDLNVMSSEVMETFGVKPSTVVRTLRKAVFSFSQPSTSHHNTHPAVPKGSHFTVQYSTFLSVCVLEETGWMHEIESCGVAICNITPTSYRRSAGRHGTCVCWPHCRSL